MGVWKNAIFDHYLALSCKWYKIATQQWLQQCTQHNLPDGQADRLAAYIIFELSDVEEYRDLEI